MGTVWGYFLIDTAMVLSLGLNTIYPFSAKTLTVSVDTGVASGIWRLESGAGLQCTELPTTENSPALFEKP